MSLTGNEQLARQVVSAIEEWTPSEAFDHESKFQNELQEYLDLRLNSGENMMMGHNEEIVVEREHGTANGDVVVNGEVGIEMKRNLSNSQTNTLRGQIENYQKEYTHVIVVACGIDDMDGWRKLKNDYENQPVGIGSDSAPVKFIHKHKSNYGGGDSVDNYSISDSSNGADGAEELANVIEDGIVGYRSLTGDGPMKSGEAIIAVAQAVLIVGFLLVVVAIILFQFIL